MTLTEEAIKNRRRTVESGAVLLPLFEELLRRPIKIEDDADVNFLTELARKQTRPRAKGVYSPSSLGSCLRQAYFSKTGKQAFPVERPVVNTYFSYGDFTHLKLQFWLHKLQREGKLELIDVELRVANRSGDFAGTIDAVVKINGVIYIIDFKGWNTMLFMSLVRNGLSEKEKQQIVGYAILLNSTDTFHFVVNDCLLVAEHKGGPIQGRAPFGFYEQHVYVSDAKEDVKRRIGRLRWHEEEDQVPDPECTSTKASQFCECVFNPHCKAEVRGIERHRAQTESGTRKRATVAPSGRAADDRSFRRGER
jgi:hypothetical protein